MNDTLRSALAELEAVKRAFPAKVDAMKTKLAAWVDANTGPGNDDAAFTNALLELGVERLLELPYADENAFEQVEKIFKKIEARNRANPDKQAYNTGWNLGEMAGGLPLDPKDNPYTDTRLKNAFAAGWTDGQAYWLDKNGG
jgi:hypothetical protein